MVSREACCTIVELSSCMHVCARACMCVCVCACVHVCAFAGSKLRGISESGLSRSDSSLSASSGSLLGDDLSDEMEEEIREVSFLSTLPCRHSMGVESALLSVEYATWVSSRGSRLH